MRDITIPCNLILSLISRTNGEDGVYQYSDDIPTKFLVDLAYYGRIGGDDVNDYEEELYARGYGEEAVEEAITLITETLGIERS